MKHCIASYARQARDGEYITIHMSEGNYEATFGINIRNKTYSFNQIKGIYNNNNIPDNIMKVANKIINFLNKSLELKTAPKKKDVLNFLDNAVPQNLVNLDDIFVNQYWD